MGVLNIQADLRARLEEALGIDVCINMPREKPEKVVVLTREGGARSNPLIDTPGIGLYCYAPTEQEAFELANIVSDKMMFELPFAGGYALVEQEAMYSKPDPDDRTPRWYLSYTIKTYKPKG